MTAELPDIPNDETIARLRKIAAIRNMSFVKYNGDYAL
jgi:hypothetical protein